MVLATSVGFDLVIPPALLRRTMLSRLTVSLSSMVTLTVTVSPFARTPSSPTCPTMEI